MCIDITCLGTLVGITIFVLFDILNKLICSSFEDAMRRDSAAPSICGFGEPFRHVAINAWRSFG